MVLAARLSVWLAHSKNMDASEYHNVTMPDADSDFVEGIEPEPPPLKLDRLCEKNIYLGNKVEFLCLSMYSDVSGSDEHLKELFYFSGSEHNKGAQVSKHDHVQYAGEPIVSTVVLEVLHFVHTTDVVIHTTVVKKFVFTRVGIHVMKMWNIFVLMATSENVVGNELKQELIQLAVAEVRVNKDNSSVLFPVEDTRVDLRRERKVPIKFRLQALSQQDGDSDDFSI